MTSIVHSVEIGRSPEEVFDYLGELEKHGEWQEQIVSVEVETDGPTRVGSRATEVRRAPGLKVKSTYEITEYDPPRKASFRVINGPVRPFGTVTVEPVGDGSRARVTLEIDLESHGVGKLLAPLAMRDMRKRVPEDQTRLKERLESGA